jgi:hypothetical protein
MNKIENERETINTLVCGGIWGGNRPTAASCAVETSLLELGLVVVAHRRFSAFPYFRTLFPFGIRKDPHLFWHLHFWPVDWD